MTDACQVWFTVTLVQWNIQVATVIIDCIQLGKGTWKLAWGKFIDTEHDYNQNIFQNR